MVVLGIKSGVFRYDNFEFEEFFDFRFESIKPREYKISRFINLALLNSKCVDLDNENFEIEKYHQFKSDGQKSRVIKCEIEKSRLTKYEIF